jgi:hypothetical protein
MHYVLSCSFKTRGFRLLQELVLSSYGKQLTQARQHVTLAPWNRRGQPCPWIAVRHHILLGYNHLDNHVSGVGIVVLCHSVSCDAKVLLSSGIIPPTIAARKRFGTCAVKAARGNSGHPRPRDGLQEWEGARGWRPLQTISYPSCLGGEAQGESPPRSTDNGERLERGGGKRRVIGVWRGVAVG